MRKSIDSVGPRPEKKKVEPLVTHKAGEVFRPKGAALEAGEQAKPKNYIDPKTQEAKANLLSEADHKVSSGKRKVDVKRSVLLVAVIIIAILLLISISVPAYMSYRSAQQKKKQAQVEAELAKDPKNIYKVAQDQQAKDAAEASKTADQKLESYKAEINGKSLAQDPKLFDTYRNAAIIASEKGDAATAKLYADQVIAYYDKNPDLKNYAPGTLFVMQKISAGEKYENN